MSANLTLTNALPTSPATGLDATAPGTLARGTYDELRSNGLSDIDIMAFAGELLALVATGVQQTPHS
jgi:hypothetical protein